jgi:hypothetical protein
VRRIDPGAAYTMEFRADRLNLQVEDERVVGATVG